MTVRGATVPIRVVLAEGSASPSSLAELLKERGFLVIESVRTVMAVVAAVRRDAPDIVVADSSLADGDGVLLSRLLLQERGIPIVLMTAHDAQDPQLLFEATRAGALDVLPRPPAKAHPEYERLAQHLARTLRVLAGVRIMTRRADRATSREPVAVDPDPVKSRSSASELIVAVGASTGGPIIIAEILRALGGHSFAFAMVVQHMVPEFIVGFGNWLESQIKVPVRIAAERLTPEKGVVYLAPPNCQFQIDPTGRFHVPSAKSVPTPHVPSIDMAFRSLAQFRPSQTTAMLLTGMGSDGAEGLKALREAKAFTIAQTPQSAVLASMPESAIALGAAVAVLSPEEIGDLLTKQLQLST